MLEVASLESARSLAAGLATKEPDSETVPLNACCGRVLSDDAVSREDVPGFSRATMDGYAVCSGDTFGASPSLPCMLKIKDTVFMGKRAGHPLDAGTCAAISTGGMLPQNADAVIPVEYTEEDGIGNCLIAKAVSPGENVASRGDDVVAGKTLLTKGTFLQPRQIGLLAAAGFDAVRVYRKPRVGIFSTGNELVSVEHSPAPGQIRDVNGALLSAYISGLGCQTTFYGIIRDEEKLFRDMLLSVAEENDFIVLSGGSSAGKADLTAQVIASVGSLLLHGISVKPGKPTVIGLVQDKPVFGLPGHPAAAYFAAENIVRPYVEALFRVHFPQRFTEAVLSDNVSSNHGRTEFVCVKLSEGTATPVYGKSGVISLLSGSDGYITVPRDAEGLNAGAPVHVCLF